MKKNDGIYSRPVAVNMIEEEGKIWGALLNGKGICEIDRKTKHGRIRKAYEHNMLGRNDAYINIEKVDNYLVLSPGLADQIAIFDLEKDSFMYIPLKKMEGIHKRNEQFWKFWNIIRYRSAVYLLGYSYPAIIKLDIESMQVEYITDWVSEIEKNIESSDCCGYFSDGHVIDGNLMLLPVECMNAIVELDLITSHTKVRMLDVSMKGIGGISSSDGRNVWIVGRIEKTNIVSCWDRKTDRIKEIYLPENGNIIDSFYAPICTNDKVYLLPIAPYHIYEISIKAGQAVAKRIMQGLCGSDNPYGWWNTMAPRLQGNILIFLAGDDLKWYEYNIVTGETENYFVYLEEDNKETERYIEALYTHSKKQHGHILISENTVPLSCFLERVAKNNNRSDKSGEGFECGKKIYEQLCKV